MVILGSAAVLVVILFMAIPIVIVAPSYLGSSKTINQEFFERTADGKLEDALVKCVRKRWMIFFVNS